MITVSAGTLLLIGLVVSVYGIIGRVKWAPIAWGLGNLAHATGILLTLAPGYLSTPLLVVVANVLVMSSLALHWAGTAHFTGLRRPWWLLLLPPLLTLLTFPVFTYVVPSQLWRIVIVSAVGSVGCIDSGRMLMAGRHKLMVGLGWVLLLVGLVSALRGITSLALILNAEPTLPAWIRVELLAPITLLLFTLWSVGMLVTSAHRSERELTDLVNQLRTVSFTDQLTQLGNRRYMQLRLDEGAARLEVDGEAYSVLLIDVDQFKLVNDRFGHDCGDYVLRTIAHTLKRAVRRADVVARWGGEEFVVLVRDGDTTAAQALAEQLRDATAKLRLRYEGTSITATVTVGGATALQGETPTDLIRRADHALYLGKRKGRNCVEWA